MMLFLKQNSKISRVSSVLKPSHIRTRGFPLASSLVWGLKTRLSHSKLIFKSLYPFLECP